MKIKYLIWALIIIYSCKNESSILNYPGCSGDIDNDGDLDVIMFNFHYGHNDVKSKILWNDGVGNFSYDDSGIGEILAVDASELIVVNGDGYLDLVIDYITNNPRTPNTEVMWGNGIRFY